MITEPLPRDSFDGEAETGTFNAKLWLRPLDKLDFDLFYKGRERDYDNPRDGYQYIRGDGLSQPDKALSTYNTSHHYISQTIGIEGTYRLPMRSRLQVEYAYEQVERENAAVEETEEDRITIAVTLPALEQLQRQPGRYVRQSPAADTYQWDQRYYALLDVDLINATPDSQRYINHPELSQYHLSNRDRLEGKLDLTWMPGDDWNLNFNLLLRDDDYDKTYLGLRYGYWQRYHLSASYAPSAELSATVYGGYDRYESEQMGRSFRGGAEKNAFEIYPPLPQASDPDRDWRLDATDSSVTVGRQPYLAAGGGPSNWLRITASWIPRATRSSGLRGGRCKPTRPAGRSKPPCITWKPGHLAHARGPVPAAAVPVLQLQLG